MGPFRIQERPHSQRDRHVVPEGAQARHFHGQPGGQHALELVCWQEEGACICPVAALRIPGYAVHTLCTAAQHENCC